ncbi:MAG: restriction endonuclease [Hyphomicrobium sp.]|nr:MAG: restriction endonuclease [Hyphomicrobium sp.]
MSRPRQWTIEELRKDAATARATFRAERLAEVAAYKTYFTDYAAIFRTLVPLTEALQSGAIDTATLTKIVRVPEAFTALRYLTAPPISDDDLMSLADVASLAPTTLARTPANLTAVAAVIGRLIDTCRFPWLAEKRKPTASELEASIVASSALIASQRIQTDRRNKAQSEQEAAVRAVLAGLQFRQVESRKMRLITDAPDPGCFCGAAKLGSKQGDVFARLLDKRLLAVECKVTNSEVNSFKRVNDTAVAKAVEWKRALGEDQVIPLLVLRGVFNPDNLLEAQRHMAIVWEHRLDDLQAFVQAAK